MVATRANFKSGSNVSAADAKKSNRQGVKAPACARSTTKTPSSSACNNILVVKHALGNCIGNSGVGLADMSSSDVLASENGADVLHERTVASGGSEVNFSGVSSSTATRSRSAQDCVGVAAPNSSKLTVGCSLPNDVDSSSTTTHGLCKKQFPPLNAGTAPLLQKLLLSRDQDQICHSFPGNTGLLLASIPLFGIAGSQLPQVRRTIMRSWHWRQFILSGANEDEEFRKTLRVPKPAFWQLLNIVEPDLVRKRTNWRVPLSPAIRQCVFLYYAGHGCSLQQLSDQFGIGRSTASGIVKFE